MKLKKSMAVVALALFSTFALAGVALAAESDDSPEGTILTPQVIVDEVNGVVYIGLPGDDGMPDECPPEEPTDPDDGTSGDADDDSEEVDDGEEPETYGPGDCIEIAIEHPSGKTHHGAIVSTVAKNLHPSMLDGIKKGEIMRYVAKTGRVDDGEAETVETKDKPEKKDKSEKTDKSDRGNKPKRDKSERGNKNKADRPNNGKANRGSRG